MVEGKKISINQVFPDEILEKILKNLDVESLCSARRSCERWMKIVDDFTSKFSKSTCLQDQKCQMYLSTFTVNSQFKKKFITFWSSMEPLVKTPIY